MAAIRVGPAINVVEAQSDTLDRSDARLVALGYRPEFRREMNLFAVVGMSFTAIGIWWTLMGTIILVVTLLVKSPTKNSASFVFTDLENFTGWENKGFVVLLGFLQAVYTLEGAETSAQVAEEARNAEWLAPIGIATSIVGSWFIGLVYLLALLFSIQSIPSIQTTSFAIPIAQLYYDAVGKQLTLLCLFVVGSCQFLAACTCFTASSRLLYALARDNAIPGKKAFMNLNRFQAPWVGVWFSAVIAIIISAAYIGSVVAFNAILSSAAIAVMLSYLQPILCRVLWPESMGARGPFHLGKYSRGINVVSALFTMLVCVLFILPTSMPVNALNMNYSVVAIGGVLILILASWIFYGQYHFKGPVSTVDMPPLTEEIDQEKKDT
ncbi:hypothetical protein FRC09_011527 [Ceratobasidium sp. 395]|nr:hypothetical protein FRC09_011527 [Ceratobasidium sp. 395]